MVKTFLKTKEHVILTLTPSYALKTRKKTRKRRLVLGTSNDTPNWKWLSLLKLLARPGRPQLRPVPRLCGNPRMPALGMCTSFGTTYTTKISDSLRAAARLSGLQPGRSIQGGTV